jgi:hypothetical protein
LTFLHPAKHHQGDYYGDAAAEEQDDQYDDGNDDLVFAAFFSC